MEKSSPFEKILWAIDPLVKNKTFQEATSRALRALSRRLRFSIQPVSVILEAQIPYLLGPGHATSDVQWTITRELQGWLRGQDLPGLGTLAVLVEKQFSVRAGVGSLIRYGENNGSQLIAAGTHAKEHSLEAQKELGTFSETLLLSSALPLFFVTPKAVIPNDYHCLFCPVDLSPASLRSLDPVAKLAQQAGLCITLFHKLDPSPKGMIDLAHDREARSGFLAEEKLRREEKLRALGDELKGKGLNVEVVLETLGTFSVAESILARVNPSPGTIVALVSNTMKDRHGFPGSVTRQVLRQARVPVWVIQP